MLSSSRKSKVVSIAKKNLRLVPHDLLLNPIKDYKLDHTTGHFAKSCRTSRPREDTDNGVFLALKATFAFVGVPTNENTQ